jgi:beta-lactamase superfamily II metal-dependent hydrolase
MGIEIDFLAVGDGERSGDAISVRWGNLNGPREQQGVLVIDGGTTKSGETLVSRIVNDYRTPLVDCVISTHPDADHAKGLASVLDQLEVNNLWMHRPWDRVSEFHDLVTDGRVTPSSLEARIKEALKAAYELELIAHRKNIYSWEPFTGAPIEHCGATFYVLGPTEEYYTELLPQFDDVPITTMALAAQYKSATFSNAVDSVIERYQVWASESLVEPTEPIRAENNSSVVLLMVYEGRQFLFTADAGVEALTRANERALLLGFDLRNSTFIQIPHHGSRRNVGPDILDAIVGEELPAFSPAVKTAYVSCAANSPKHPSPKVVNAFIRRGAAVYPTNGSSICFSIDAPTRYGWSSLTPVPLQSEDQGDE